MENISNFAENKLHSAIRKQAPIALIGSIFAENKLHSAIRKQAPIAKSFTTAHIYDKQEQNKIYPLS